jgi:hypothetical protein
MCVLAEFWGKGVRIGTAVPTFDWLELQCGGMGRVVFFGPTFDLDGNARWMQSSWKAQQYYYYCCCYC